MSNIIQFPKREERIPYKTHKKSRQGDPQKGKGAKKKKQEKGRKTGKQFPERKKKSIAHLGSQRQRQLVIVLIILFILVGLWAMVRKTGVEVFVGEKSYGLLKGKTVTVEYLENTLTAQLEAENKTKVKINETIQVIPLRITGSRKEEVCTLDYLLPKVRKAVTFQVGASVIQVDGNKVAVLANEADAKAVLADLKAEYVPKGAKMKVSFVEKVEIVSQFVDSKEMITKEQAIEKLQQGKKAQKTYTVKSGDAIYSVAKNADMKVEELLDINKGMTIETSLFVGQVLQIMVTKPFVSVKTVETTVMTDIEPKTYEYRKDNTKNKGYQKVIQQGRAGQKESTMQITRINGFVEDEKEISKKVTVEPVAEIILQGTK